MKFVVLSMVFFSSILLGTAIQDIDDKSYYELLGVAKGSYSQRFRHIKCALRCNCG